MVKVCYAKSSLRIPMKSRKNFTINLDWWSDRDKENGVDGEVPLILVCGHSFPASWTLSDVEWIYLQNEGGLAQRFDRKYWKSRTLPGGGRNFTINLNWWSDSDKITI